MKNLIQDFKDFGVCQDVLDPNLFGASNDTCTTTTSQYGSISIVDGVCSDLTEILLRNRTECGFLLQKQRLFIYNTIDRLLRSMCNSSIVDELMNSISLYQRSRLVPLEEVYDYADATIYSDLQLGK